MKDWIASSNRHSRNIRLRRPTRKGLWRHPFGSDHNPSLPHRRGAVNHLQSSFHDLRRHLRHSVEIKRYHYPVGTTESPQSKCRFHCLCKLGFGEWPDDPVAVRDDF